MREICQRMAGNALGLGAPMKGFANFSIMSCRQALADFRWWVYLMTHYQILLVVIELAADTAKAKLRQACQQGVTS
jgi:hypothetical protein